MIAIYWGVMAMEPSNWMAGNLSVLGPLRLAQLVMPASHDSAMYETNDCTPDITVKDHGPYGANACNTQTQTTDIATQLQNGSRYFDVRPVLFDGQIYTGHYATSSPIVLGCNGPLLSDYLSQVASFMQSSGDLVILKFSHYYNRDKTIKRNGFTQSQMETLIQQVQAALGDVLCCLPCPEDGLISLTLNDYIGDGGRVLAVFDALPDALHDTDHGIYSYADAPAAGDLVVFDEYADKNTVSEMAEDQKAKLVAPENHDGCLFLLSWTLTQDAMQAAACGLDISKATSILDLAQEAHDALGPTLDGWVEDGVITPQTIPNLIYVDANGVFSLDAALKLNAYFHDLTLS